MKNRTLHSAHSAVAVVVYLAGFVAVLLIVSHFYLLPAIEATRGADPKQRELLAWHARLVLIVVLFVLLGGLMLTFRISRFFRPRPGPRPKPTQYVDAWEESGRRMKTPPVDARDE